MRTSHAVQLSDPPNKACLRGENMPDEDSDVIWYALHGISDLLPELGVQELEHQEIIRRCQAFFSRSWVMTK